MAIGQCGIKEKNKHRNIKFIDRTEQRLQEAGDWKEVGE